MKVEVKQPSSYSVRWLPFVIGFPMLVIAFQGCFEDGCQGALNAQSRAAHEALVVGGWLK